VGKGEKKTQDLGRGKTEAGEKTSSKGGRRSTLFVRSGSANSTDGTGAKESRKDQPTLSLSIERAQGSGNKGRGSVWGKSGTI